MSKNVHIFSAAGENFENFGRPRNEASYYVIIKKGCNEQTNVKNILVSHSWGKKMYNVNMLRLVIVNIFK